MIGSNVSTVGGIAKGFIQAKEWGCECIQIYTTLSRTWNIRTRSRTDINAFKAAWKSSKVRSVVGHVPFLVNLATEDVDLYRRSVQRLVQEIISADELGIDRIVLHPGSYGKSDILAGITRIAHGLEEAFAQLPNLQTKILLETMAGQGTQIGKNFQELSLILERLKSYEERIGICFDTCHIYASGYNVRGYHGYASVMNQLDSVIGVHRIGAFHLNDSKYPLGSRRDRHVSIGKGQLGLEIFHATIHDERFKLIPKIIENPDRDRESFNDIKLLKDLLDKQQKIEDSYVTPVLKQANLY